MRAAPLTADAQRLVIPDARIPSGDAFSVLLGGRRIWTVRAPERDDDGALSLAWPPSLAERLTGRARLAVEHAGREVAAATVAFDDDPSEFVLTEPGTGIPQVVNKWGRIARSFEGRDAVLIEQVLDEAERLIQVLHSTLGIDLFVTGGTLLGPVRNGRILPHDDDADLAYLSRHTNPSDVALESFGIERTLAAHGYETVRHSSGHLQLLFPGGTVTDRFYLDIFTYFECDGWFYGTFHAREPAETVTIHPLKPLAVNGRMLPGPAEPAELLAAIYGPSWEVPDPTFAFVTPPAAFRRYYWWLNHFDVDRENWEDHHRAEIEAGPGRAPSGLAVAAAGSLPASSTVLDLGCGLGTDARYLADHGHRVLAVDYSRPALAWAKEHLAHDGGVSFERANLTMARHALHLRKRCAELDTTVHVHANHLFNALSPLGWDTTLMLIKHLLAAPGSTAFLEVGVAGAEGSASWVEYQPVDWRRFQEQLHRYSLSVEEQDDDGAGAATSRRVLVRRERA
ncbi:class I SAM-dependent methyltransferase [Arthrobacter agilis]|uniref:class I SAM-dependent methyltransferase n=1 Tax=Arthrobacter agilis TaxID=37921 RepID=UPI0027855709|nr:class I SAM-dependent methyltransferase [Arthrobacter agilis]MDQ0737040.1 SAM-dependent methyltransferase [Arthrobacter agilis]